MKERAFKNYSKDDWITLINNSLKNTDANSIKWEIFNGLEGKPFATREDVTLFSGSSLNCSRNVCKTGIVIHDISEFSLAEADGVEAIWLDMDPSHLPKLTFKNMQEDVDWYIPYELLTHPAMKKHAPVVVSENINISCPHVIAETWDGFTFPEICRLIQYFGGNCDLVLKLKAGKGSEEKILHFLDFLHRMTHWIERENLSIEELSWLFARIHIMVPVNDKFLFESAFLRSMQIVWFNLQKAYGIAHNNLKFTVLIDNNDLESTLADQLILNTTAMVAGIIGGAEALFVQPGDSIENKYEYQMLSRNLQLICKNESRLDTVKDALAGSHALEDLTAKLTNYIWDRL